MHACRAFRQHSLADMRLTISRTLAGCLRLSLIARSAVASQSCSAVTLRAPVHCACTSAMSNPAIDSRASAILAYWFGDDWDTQPKLYHNAAYFKKWFMGGKAVDEECLHPVWSPTLTPPTAAPTPAAPTLPLRSCCCNSQIVEKFGADLVDMEAGKLDAWAQEPTTLLAGVVLMDQLSRNIHRNSAKPARLSLQMYALDHKALTWAKQAVAVGSCKALPFTQQAFLLLPYEHSEVLADQQECVRLFQEMAADVQAAVEASPGDELGPPLLKLVADMVVYAEAHLEIVAKWGRFPHRNAILGRASTPEEEAGLKDKSIRGF
ncbi:hypothetical protein QJQ45_015381 [Haematococcus lacustris]|nr:hypothetical protein QJQ45_015381 [Haematococcus lacustris]